jgi:flagellar hook assembly protein FlgD
VLVTTSSGKLVRTISKSAVNGKNKVTWDGKWSSDNKAHTGTFYVQVTASDSAGNSTSTGKLKTSIRNYEVVKTSTNQVKIVAR